MAQLNDLLVNGASRFLNIIQGTAASATALTTAVGGATSPVYIGSAGTPVAINLAQASVASAASAGNAASVNNHAFGSLSTVSTITTGLLPTIPLSKISGTGSLASVSTITSGMLPTHNHTTAQITSFNTAVDNRITRDKILGEISTGATWTGSYSFVEGGETTATAQNGHAEGYRTLATVDAANWSTAAHAEGYQTTARGVGSHAEGVDTFAYGSTASHAEGKGTTAYVVAHAEGTNTFAHANAHAEGMITVAYGPNSHSEGYATTARGSNSHAGGQNTIASKDNQTAIGKFNATVESALFIVGNGSSAEDTGEVRSNAMYVTTAGNVFVANNIYATKMMQAEQFRGVATRRIFVPGTQAAPTTGGAWTGDLSPYFFYATDLQDGQEITYWVPLPTTGNVTLDLTFGDGSSTGPLNCYYGGTSRLTTHYGQGQAVHLTYRKDVKIPSTGTTKYTGWWADANYDSNSNTIDVLQGTYTIPVAGATAGLKQYSLFAEDASGKYSSFTTQNGTAVSKAVNRTDYFDISKIYYASTSKNTAANANIGTSVLRWAASLVDLRYTLNITTSALTARKPLYLIFDKTATTSNAISDTLYKLAGTGTTDWWTQTLPTSADDKIYVEVSRAVYDGYRADLAVNQRFYEFTDKLHCYDNWNSGFASSSTNASSASYASNAAKVNNLTVETAVPANAVFTDTAVTQTALGNTSAKTYLVGGAGSATTTAGLNLSKTIGFTSSSNAEALEFSCPNDKIFSFKKTLSGNNIDVGWDWSKGDGSGMAFRSKDATNNNPGGFDIYARETTAAAYHLIGATDGTLRWNNRRVVTSNNGAAVGTQAQPVYIDASGYAQGCATAQMFVGTAQYVKTSNTHGYNTDLCGNFIHQTSDTADYWNIQSSGKAVKFRFYYESGNIDCFGNAIKLGTSAHTINTEKSVAAGTSCYVTTVTDVATTGANSFAFGYKCTAVGNSSWAEGDCTLAYPYAHAEGVQTVASGSTGAHAEGYKTTASHDYSHAEGSQTKATGQSSHAEGENTTASGQNSHAEGQQNLASAQCSHVEGMGTRATTFCAHAGGENSTASGEASHAGGGWIIANKDFQTAIGKFNATVDDALFIVGNGKIVSGTVTRSNAMYVTTAGNINCVSVTQTSDERLKENVNPLTTADKSILDVLEPKQFTLKADERHQLHYGFIAQDVERQINALGFPTSSHSLVDIADNEEAYYSLNYTELIPLLVQRVKELEQRVAQLENK